MPEGSVCCDNGLEYCLSGQTCNNDGTCRRGGLGGSGGSSDDDDGDSLFTTSSTSTTSTTSSTSTSLTSFGSNNFPTGLVSGGPDDDSSDSNDDDAPRSGDDGEANDNTGEPDAAMVHGPSFFAAAIALIPLLL
jgi:hypothetical protein